MNNNDNCDDDVEDYEVDEDDDCDDYDDTVRLLCCRLQLKYVDKEVSSSCLASLFSTTTMTTLPSFLLPWA